MFRQGTKGGVKAKCAETSADKKGVRVRVMAPSDTEKVYVLRGMSASFPSILLREMLTNALRSALSSSHQQT